MPLFAMCLVSGSLSSAATAGSRSADGRTSSSQADTAASGVATSEHGGIPARGRRAVSHISSLHTNTRALAAEQGKEMKWGGNALQHIRHDKEPDVAAADVDLVQMADSAVARRHGDVLELYVHVVFGCAENSVSVFSFAASS